MGLDILLGPIAHLRSLRCQRKKRRRRRAATSLAFFEVPSEENTCGDESLSVLVAARAVVNS